MRRGYLAAFQSRCATCQSLQSIRVISPRPSDACPIFRCFRYLAWQSDWRCLVASDRHRSACSRSLCPHAASHLRTRPGKPATTGIASMHFSNSMESCLLAALTRITSGMPLASTTICRLEPSLPLSVGLRPVSWPSGGLAPRSHLCLLGSNQSGHARADVPAWLGANAAKRHGIPSRKRRQQVIPLP